MKEQKLKAFIAEEKPEFKRGYNQDGKIIRNVYSRKLEDLTFNDLNMLGYTNPNTFVKDWVKSNGTFDKNKIIWVAVYVESCTEHMSMENKDEH